MENKLLGLHHITAIANQAQRNLDFYTQVLGLRLVKKTVNFDDPSTYHFYFGDAIGTPGTILTFFPWEGIGPGKQGTGMATHIGYAVEKGALEFWKNRLQNFEIPYEEGSIFGENMLSFQDPDGLQLQLIEPLNNDIRSGWTTEEISLEVALKGFHQVTLTLREVAPTAQVLTQVLGYQLQHHNGNRYRFAIDTVQSAHLIDIIEEPTLARGQNLAGTNHHIAFRVKDEKVLMEFREKVLAAGLQITPKIDRDYFYSLYFREPGGVLFEIATDNPGFLIDENRDDLGSGLQLPHRYQPLRSQIEAALPKLK